MKFEEMARQMERRSAASGPPEGFDDHAAHVRAHTEFVAWMRGDLLSKYQRAPRWRRRPIDRLLAKQAGATSKGAIA